MTDNLFIQIRNGGPFEHPITEWNLRQFFPDLDVDNPPVGFEKFIRKPLPNIGPYETLVGSYYEKIDNVWQDVHHVRELTAVEKSQKINSARESFPFADTWTLNEATFNWIPPVSYPDDGNKYYWDNDVKNWVILPNQNNPE